MKLQPTLYKNTQTTLFSTELSKVISNIQQRRAVLNLSLYFFQMLYLNLLCESEPKILPCNTHAL